MNPNNKDLPQSPPDVASKSELEKASNKSISDQLQPRLKALKSSAVKKPGPEARSIAVYAAKAAADVLLGSYGISLSIPKSRKGKESEKKTLEDKKSELVKELLASGIDPLLFDALLSNEIDRRLKTRFGISFLVLTFIFTSASYGIVILNGIYHWNISTVAITGLVIETPIQFIGLLYIIARNLFPDGMGPTRAGKQIPVGANTSAHGHGA